MCVIRELISKLWTQLINKDLSLVLTLDLREMYSKDTLLSYQCLDQC